MKGVSPFFFFLDEERQVRTGLLSYLQAAVKLVSSEFAYGGSRGCTCTDSHESAQVLCDAIDRLMSHRLRPTRHLSPSTDNAASPCYFDSV